MCARSGDSAEKPSSRGKETRFHKPFLTVCYYVFFQLQRYQSIDAIDSRWKSVKSGSQNEEPLLHRLLFFFTDRPTLQPKNLPGTVTTSGSL